MLQSTEEFRDFVKDSDQKYILKGYKKTSEKELPAFHVTWCPPEKFIKWKHLWWLRDNASYRAWWRRQPVWIKKIIREQFNNKLVLMPENKLTIEKDMTDGYVVRNFKITITILKQHNIVTHQIKWEHIAPHLDRNKNGKIRNIRGSKKSKNCYILNDLPKAVVNHCCMADRNKFYRPSNEKYGRRKYVLVFKDGNAIRRFEQVDLWTHKHMGRNQWGIVVEGIIEIKMKEGSNDISEAHWRWIDNI
jgi:hypothetical protein